MARRIIGAGLAAVLVLGPAALAEPGAAVDEVEILAPKMLDELVVPAKPRCLKARTRPSAPPPRLVDTFPAPGAEVRAGVLVVRLTFDRPMTCDGFLTAAAKLPSPCPSGRQHMSQSFDRKTIWVLCQAMPDTAYAVQLGGRNPFRSLEGQPLEPKLLRFHTSAAAGAASVREALAQDTSQITQAHLPRR